MVRPVLLRVDASGGTDEVCAHIRDAAQAGFDGIEWAVSDATQVAVWQEPLAGNDAPPTNDGPRCGVGALSLALQTIVSAEAIAELEDVLPSVSQLGAGALVVAIPPLIRRPNEPGFARYQDALNFVYDVLRAVRFEAEAAGVSIAVGVALGGCLLSPVEVRDLIDAANSWAVGVCVDFDAVSVVADPFDWLSTLRHRVHAVRIGKGRPERDRLSYSEPRASARADTPSPARDARIERLVTVLEDLRYDGPVMVNDNVCRDDWPRLIAELTGWSARPAPG